MNEKLRDEMMDDLFKAILTLESIDECYDFFDDLCTISELKAMAQRFKVAMMLENRHVYSEVVRETRASTATISRVNRCLHYGNDGYKTAIERIKDGGK